MDVRFVILIVIVLEIALYVFLFWNWWLVMVFLVGVPYLGIGIFFAGDAYQKEGRLRWKMFFARALLGGFLPTLIFGLVPPLLAIGELQRRLTREKNLAP